MLIDDMQLVREYAASHAEPAFTQLVNRHLNLVYSAALRRTGNPHLAEEIAQSVFVLLARKAGTLSAETVLCGWLYRTTQYAAANVLKQRHRQQRREQEVYMQSTLNTPETAETWKHIAPILDAAMDTLNERDRNAVVLRYFENRTLAEVGTALGVSEDGARMCVNRALEKLRVKFGKCNVMLTATAIAGVVAANAIQAAPIGLATTISAAALTGTTITASATMLMTTIPKVIATFALTATVGAGIYEARQAANARAGMQTFQQQHASQIQQLRRERDDAQNELAAMTNTTMMGQTEKNELLKSRGELTLLKNENQALVAAAKDAEALATRLGVFFSNTPPVKTFVATTTTKANWGEGIITGGWATSSGNRAVVVVVPTPGDTAEQIHLKSYVWELAEDTAQKVGLEPLYANGRNENHTLKMSPEQLQTLLDEAKNGGQINEIAEPEATTMNGMEAQIGTTVEQQTAAGEKYSTGPTLTFFPTISPDGQSVQLTMTAQLNQVINYPPE